jgi:hypothetical protein
MTTFLELLGNFPYRGLPPLFLRKSARFLGQCSCYVGGPHHHTILVCFTYGTMREKGKDSIPLLNMSSLYARMHAGTADGDRTRWEG